MTAPPWLTAIRIVSHQAHNLILMLTDFLTNHFLMTGPQCAAAIGGALTRRADRRRRKGLAGYHFFFSDKQDKDEIDHPRKRQRQSPDVHAPKHREARHAEETLHRRDVPPDPTSCPLNHSSTGLLAVSTRAPARLPTFSWTRAAAF